MTVRTRSPGRVDPFGDLSQEGGGNAGLMALTLEIQSGAAAGCLMLVFGA
jgi:hypothetical protein